MTFNSLPQTMKAAKAFDYDDVRLVELPVPSLGPKDALVKISCCGICSGDVTPWYIKKKCPIVLGHEPCGTIVALGAEACPRFSLGDRVFIHHHAPCYQCRHCRLGHFSMCATWRASHLDPGGLAQYVRVPQVNLEHDTLILPDDIDDTQGALIEPIACVVKAFRRARFKPEDRVAIIGLGFIGQAMVCLARHWGAELILATDFLPFRCKRALALGAHAVCHPEENGGFQSFIASHTDGLGADLIFCCPSSPNVILQAITAAAPGGRVLMFMAPQPGVTMSLEPYDLFFREVDLIGTYSCGPDDTRETLALIRQGVFPTSQLVTHRFALEKTLQACRLTAEAKDSLKVIVDVS